MSSGPQVESKFTSESTLHQLCIEPEWIRHSIRPRTIGLGHGFAVLVVVVVIVVVDVVTLCVSGVSGSCRCCK